MKTIIKIDQDEALKIGMNEYGEKTIEFNPATLTPEQRAELLSSDKRNDAYILTSYMHPTRGCWTVEGLPVIGKIDDDTLLIILNARIKIKEEIIAKEKAEQEKRFAKFLATKDEDNIAKWALSDFGCFDKEETWRRPNRVDTIISLTQDDLKKSKGNQKVQEKIDRIEALQADILAKAQAKWDRGKAEYEAEKEVARQRKSEQIKQWVEMHGTENQKARYAEELLPESEIADAIREETYAPLSDWPRYEKIKIGDFCTCSYGEDINFHVDLKESATAEEFEQMQEIRRLMPKATIEIREHLGECSRCDESEHRTGFMVRVTVGEFEFSREYGLK